MPFAQCWEHWIHVHTGYLSTHSLPLLPSCKAALQWHRGHCTDCQDGCLRIGRDANKTGLGSEGDARSTASNRLGSAGVAFLAQITPKRRRRRQAYVLSSLHYQPIDLTRNTGEAGCSIPASAPRVGVILFCTTPNVAQG